MQLYGEFSCNYNQRRPFFFLKTSLEKVYCNDQLSSLSTVQIYELSYLHLYPHYLYYELRRWAALNWLDS